MVWCTPSAGTWTPPQNNGPDDQYSTDMDPDEEWCISLPAWEQFCAACSHLRKWNWLVVPFATAFFEVFARYPKPQLEILQLGYCEDWGLDTYHQYHPRVMGGFGGTAQNPQVILEACPALRELYIGETDHPSSLDENVFGGAFVEALAKYCRRLERFKLESTTFYRPQVSTITSFTNRAMAALATLPMLSEVLLKSVNITGDGLFALVMESVKGEWTQLARKYEISVGSHDEESSHPSAFYGAVTQFLTRLAKWPREEDAPHTRASHCIVLRLLNGKDVAIRDELWRRSYLAHLRELIVAANQQHPQIRLRVVVKHSASVNSSCQNCCGRVGGVQSSDRHISDFCSIVSMSLSTAAAVRRGKSWTINRDLTDDAIVCKESNVHADDSQSDSDSNSSSDVDSSSDGLDWDNDSEPDLVSVE